MERRPLPYGFGLAARADRPFLSFLFPGAARVAEALSRTVADGKSTSNTLDLRPFGMRSRRGRPRLLPDAGGACRQIK